MNISELLRPFPLDNTKPDTIITDITDDSRKVKPGTLFVARSGATQNGAKFIQDAKNAGASLCIGGVGSGADLEIDDLAGFLPTLLERFYGEVSQGLTLNAVTGTNGKTTTAFLLHQVLQDWSGASALTGTVCQMLGDTEIPSQLTTPGLFDFYKLMAQVRQHNLRYLNFEASSHALDQGRIGHLVVKTAIFTNLSQDHLDYHGDMENYFQAKFKLFRQHLGPGSRAIINIDNVWGQRIAQEADFAFWTTSTQQEADFQLQDLSIDPLRPKYKITGPELDLQIETLLPGDFNKENILGAVAALHHLGVPAHAIAQSISKMSVPGRLQKIPHPTLNVFVDYAHTPDALERVTASLRKLTRGKLITVFGCGGDRDRTKRPLMAQAVERASDIVFVTSDNPRTEEPQQIFADIVAGLQNPASAHVIVDRKHAIEEAIQILGADDVLLIAGKGHEDYQIIGTSKYPFDDRQIARQALEVRA